MLSYNLALWHIFKRPLICNHAQLYYSGWPAQLFNSHPWFSLPRDILQVAPHISRVRTCTALGLPYGGPQSWSHVVLLFHPYVSLLGWHESCHSVEVSVLPQISPFLPMPFLLLLFLIPLTERLPEHGYIGASQSILTDWLAGKLWLGKIKAKLALGEILRVILKIKDSEECLEGG